MEISFVFIISIFLIGFVGSFISGMVGIGGAIINYPMLLYIPAALGIANFSVYEVSGITAIQVLFATIGGVWAYRKGGYLNKSLIGYMGISVLIGSFAGGLFSSYMSEEGVNVIYGVLALLAVIMMFMPKKGGDETSFDTVNFNKWIASLLALIVGIGAGIVGAGGAFLLVPIMLVVLKIPTRITIASSLAITFISSMGATSSKIMTGQVLFIPAAIMIVASLIASPLGATRGKKVNTNYLQWILGILISGTAVKIWFDILN
ncbi:sulfite exporter TauE/SafE family protein [Virgibacillus ndiopensis]|uniref:sulfite exporter TauE/SafE family protein n=1 Tax=Virgibacillus ndiopensis TaxID=2004408 RepID=UPI00159BCD27|nr:sulfite exporter TauE/SafE family protein [Virgibacillus ndiopensis]